MSACVDSENRPVGQENDIQTQRCNGANRDMSLYNYLLKLEQKRRHNHDVDFAIDLDGSSDGSIYSGWRR